MHHEIELCRIRDNWSVWDMVSCNLKYFWSQSSAQNPSIVQWSFTFVYKGPHGSGLYKLSDFISWHCLSLLSGHIGLLAISRTAWAYFYLLLKQVSSRYPLSWCLIMLSILKYHVLSSLWGYLQPLYFKLLFCLL